MYITFHTLHLSLYILHVYNISYLAPFPLGWPTHTTVQYSTDRATEADIRRNISPRYLRPTSSSTPGVHWHQRSSIQIILRQLFTNSPADHKSQIVYCLYSCTYSTHSLLRTHPADKSRASYTHTHPAQRDCCGDCCGVPVNPCYFCIITEPSSTSSPSKKKN